MRLRIVIAVLVGIFNITGFAFAEMSSVNYQIDWDSITAGGESQASSTSYNLRDTIENQGSGLSTSATYQDTAGYRAGFDVSTLPAGEGADPRPRPAECASDVTAPVVSGVTVVGLLSTSARILWTTDGAAGGHVDFGTAPDLMTGLVVGDGVTVHSATLTGLASATTYYFQVEVFDTCGNSSTASGYSFTTGRATLAPSNVTSFVATPGDGYVSLSWIRPPETDFAGVIVLSCLNEYPSSYTDADCVTIYNGTGITARHSGLTNGTTYYYGAFAYDTDGYYSSGALASATPVAAITDVCGDTVCGSTESSATCPADCPVAPVDVCGDGACGGTENSSSCPADCAEAPTEEPPVEEPPAEEPGEETDEETGEETTEETGGGTTICGDTLCSIDESSALCPSDCPSIEIPTTTVTEEEILPFSDISIVSSAGNVGLEISEEAGVTVLSGTTVSFLLSQTHLNKEVAEVILTLGADTYLLQDSDYYYFTTVTFPDAVSKYAAHLIVSYADGTTQTFDWTVNAVSWGLVYEDLDGQEAPVSEAKITLYQSSGGEWVVWTPRSGQANPVSSSANGTFAWYVENGAYKVVVAKNGYNEASRTLEITNNIVNPAIKISKEIVLPITVETITQAVGETVTAITETVTAIQESPVAQTAATVATPVVAAVAVTSTVVLATSSNLLAFLQYLFTAPILLFGRRKRKAYGVVYNAFTKTPIDLALI
ncbi:MAG: fibronectin type III domain-containing protein, partial [Candidatus Liptonbacteria bacterium]